MEQHKLDLYDTKMLIDIRSTLLGMYQNNFKSRDDLLTIRLETLLRNIDGILENHGGQNEQ